jgi:hypothetical protein
MVKRPVLSVKMGMCLPKKLSTRLLKTKMCPIDKKPLRKWELHNLKRGLTIREQLHHEGGCFKL